MSEALPVQRVTLSEDLRLVSVVEFVPWSYASPDRATPENSEGEGLEAWHGYWKASLADAGIHDLEPLHPGSFLVPIHQLTAPHVLRKLLQVEFEAVSFSGEADAVENLGALTGGLALLDAGRVVIEPRCCCDLSHLESWRNAALRQPGGFWMGHPLLLGSLEDGGLVLREEDEEIDALPLRAWCMSPDALARAIPGAVQELEDFSRRLEPILAELLFPALAPELARRLAGLEPR